MSIAGLGYEFRKIVSGLPELIDAKPMSMLELKSAYKPELRTSLQCYAKLYNLPIGDDNNLLWAVGKIKSFDFDLVGQIYQKKQENYRGLILYIHGYLDHFGLYKEFIKFFTQNNYIVVGVDLPGHGLSTGKIADIVDFGQYASSIEAITSILKAKYQHLELNYSLFGFSAGAAVGIEYLLRNASNLPFNKACWFAPLLRVPKWRYTELARYLDPIVKYVSRQNRNVSHDPVFVNFIRLNDPLQAMFLPLRWVTAMHEWEARLAKYKPLELATCIIQGTADATIDWQYNIPSLVKLFPNHRVHYIADGYHNLCNEAEEYRKVVYDYVLNFLEAV